MRSTDQRIRNRIPGSIRIERDLRVERHRIDGELHHRGPGIDLRRGPLRDRADERAQGGLGNEPPHLANGRRAERRSVRHRELLNSLGVRCADILRGRVEFGGFGSLRPGQRRSGAGTVEYRRIDTFMRSARARSIVVTLEPPYWYLRCRGCDLRRHLPWDARLRTQEAHELLLQHGKECGGDEYPDAEDAA